MNEVSDGPKIDVAKAGELFSQLLEAHLTPRGYGECLGFEVVSGADGSAILVEMRVSNVAAIRFVNSIKPIVQEVLKDLPEDNPLRALGFIPIIPVIGEKASPENRSGQSRPRQPCPGAAYG